MARYPGAAWRPLPEAAKQPAMTATQIILHTAVDAPGPTSLYGYFARGDVVYESHFYVTNDGMVEQYVDTSHTADANRTANRRAVSIETEDDGKPEQTPWSEKQLAALVKLVDWLCTTHGIPRAKVVAHDRPGIGWHSMFGAPSPWTPVEGKTCPGPVRIRQMPHLIEAVATLERDRAAARPVEHDDEGDESMAGERWFGVRGKDRGDRWLTNWIEKVPLGGKVGATHDAQVKHKSLLAYFRVGVHFDENGNTTPVDQVLLDAVPARSSGDP